MNLYKRVLSFVKPYLKQVGLAILFTFGYVVFNNISLWVSVDFIGELFPKETPAAASSIPDSTTGLTPEGIQTEAARDSAASGKPESLPGPDHAKTIKKISGNVKLYASIKQKIKDILIQEDRYNTLRVVCLVIFITFFMKNVFEYLRHVTNRYIQISIINNIRNAIQKSVMYLPLTYFNEHHSGRLTSILFNDVKSIREVIRDTFGKILLTPIQLMVNLIILFLISWKLSLLTLIIMPVSGILLVKIGQSMRRKSRRVYEQISVVLSHFQEAVSGIRIVKAFTSEEKEINKFEDANLKFLKVQFRTVKLESATSPMTEVIAVCILIALFWYGGNLVYKGEFEAEDFIRFLIFLFAMFQPLRDLSGVNNMMQQGMAAAERIFTIIDSEHEVYDKPGAVTLNSFDKDIVYDHVSFQYNQADGNVLKDIHLNIHKGEMVAFVGHSGSGKTTLINLLPRFYEIEHGEIRIDGVSTRDMTLHSLRRQIGIVTQDSILFNDTIRANITYGTDDATDEQIIEAAKAANAWEFIEKMELGLDSLIGERGVNLSGGQKQRLSIARAILRNTSILILDEATSSLDTESEKLVQEAIDGLMQNRTVLVIAHRLSTVLHADKIVVLNQGQIQSVGPHRELLTTSPLYKRLYEMQFRDEVPEVKT